MATVASAGLPSLSKTDRTSHTHVKRSEDGKEGLWSSLLDSVASGKKLAEKNMVILGGNRESQTEFLEALSQDSPQYQRRNERLQSKKPPIANRFALGYTYQDILDADQDDILARVSMYMLSDSDPSFSPLLKGLFSPATIPETLAVVLLDWDSPRTWIRELQQWVRILRTILNQLDNNCKDAMDENMKEWSDKRKGARVDASSNPASESNINLPLGPGEWDEALGIPLCVVCQNAEKIDRFEREHSWKDDEFDFVLQYMRTILLKHGGSLIYTASSAPGSLQNLIRSSLDITSLLQRNPLKHNVIDRDRILVPPNWDSWGKIRVLREGFDVEGISNTWSVDIRVPPQLSKEKRKRSKAETDRAQGAASPSNGRTTPSQPAEDDDEEQSVSVAAYERIIQDPNSHQSSALQFGSGISAQQGLANGDGTETPCQDTQDFLAGQVQVLDRLKAEDEAQKAKDPRSKPSTGANSPTTPTNPRFDGQLRPSAGGRVNEHLGPVQFNMGGISVDADDALKSLKDRSTASTSEEGEPRTPASGANESEEASSVENEKLKSFFAGLMSKGSGSASNSPKQ